MNRLPVDPKFSNLEIVFVREGLIELATVGASASKHLIRFSVGTTSEQPWLGVLDPICATAPAGVGACLVAP